MSHLGVCWHFCLAPAAGSRAAAGGRAATGREKKKKAAISCENKDGVKLIDRCHQARVKEMAGQRVRVPPLVL